MYSPRTICRTCKIPRPARSKHCSICNVCVARFDHHCPWINCCVGAQNLRYFMIMLFSTAFYTLYGTYLFTGALMDFLDKSRVWRQTIFDETLQMRRPVGYSEVFSFVVYYRGLQSSMAMFCGLISIVIICFGLYQLYLGIRNTTTNETFKYDSIRFFDISDFMMKVWQFSKRDFARAYCSSGESEENEGKRWEFEFQRRH